MSGNILPGCRDFVLHCNEGEARVYWVDFLVLCSARKKLYWCRTVCGVRGVLQCRIRVVLSRETSPYAYTHSLGCLSPATHTEL